eukprot:TRINITY_DN16266_c1_g1_i1.p1 TRINITY_DN16266_c1_g1~~TRINITY_DN16266_c1_g1_i1.p1  ORF type:complete len:436 (-),score=21.34 TRINITY_DN16266_c1_g1_i1:33-1256(-)
MLQVIKEGYESHATVVFQRLSVIVTEFVLVAAAWYKLRKCSNISEVLAGACLVLCNSGLIIVDHIHFQYNGLLLGILMWSILAMEEGNVLLSGFLFAVLINMKHLFVFAGPLYFVYILRTYICNKQLAQGLLNLTLMGSVVIGVCAVSLGPFIVTGQGAQLLQRLFPFGRGLCHAYWAANIWSIYSFIDKLLTVVLGVESTRQAAMTGGLVQEAQFQVIPQISPLMSAALVLFAQLPLLINVIRSPHQISFGRGVAYSYLCSFMFGFHVHEKAVLVVTIPLAFYAFQDVKNSGEYVFLSTVSNYALLPLLFRDEEYYIKIVIFLSYQLLVEYLLQKKQNLNWGQRMYIFGLIVLEVFASWVHPVSFGGKLPFLPLLLTSVYCSLGMLLVWIRFASQYIVDILKVKIN